MAEDKLGLLSESRFDSVRNRSYIALDVPSLHAATRLVEHFGTAVTGYKVGLELFHAAGYQMIEWLVGKQKRVFLDVKLHDIPTTVNRALRVICEFPIEVVNVHASGGSDMLAAAREAVDSASHHPTLIGVTVLTSLSTANLKEIGIDHSTDALVVKWSQLCQSSGLDGVVASALDVRAIRETCGPDFFTMVPGTRPKGAAQNDQQRSLTPQEAMKNGSTALVLGRAVTRAQNASLALYDIWEDMLQGLSTSDAVNP